MVQPSSILSQFLAGEPCKREVVFFSEKAEFFSAHLFVNLVQKSSTSLFSLVVEHPLRKGKVARSTRVGGMSIVLLPQQNFTNPSITVMFLITKTFSHTSKSLSKSISKMVGEKKILHQPGWMR